MYSSTEFNLEGFKDKSRNERESFFHNSSEEITKDALNDIKYIARIIYFQKKEVHYFSEKAMAAEPEKWWKALAVFQGADPDKVYNR